MARLLGENIEQFDTGSSSKGSYFALKKDKETAKVRFLYQKPEDIEGFTVHKVSVGDRDRYVDCIADRGECPFCQAKIAKTVRIFVPLFNEDTEQFQIWERGQTFYGKLSGLCSHFGNLVRRVMEVERNGKPHDTQTKYEIYPVGEADGTTLEDILDDCGMEELKSPLGTIILQKSADDMEYYINHGEFPEEKETTVRRRGRAEEPEDLPFEEDEKTEETPRRGSRGRSRF